MARIAMKFHWFALLFGVLAVTGCASLQDAHYEHTQKLRTECAYLKFWWSTKDAGGSDYKRGWKAGYYDVITGGDGQPPMFAPHCYWSPGQILKHCDEKRHEWYAGFQDGAMMASLQPDTHYLKVWAPPACPPGHYTMPSSDAGPAMVPPSESPNLQPTPDSESAQSPMESGSSDPELPPGASLPPVPEKPMPAP